MSLKRYSGGVWTDCASIKKYSAGAWADCQSVKKYSSRWIDVWVSKPRMDYESSKSSDNSDAIKIVIDNSTITLMIKTSAWNSTDCNFYFVTNKSGNYGETVNLALTAKYEIDAGSPPSITAGLGCIETNSFLVPWIAYTSVSTTAKLANSLYRVMQGPAEYITSHVKIETSVNNQIIKVTLSDLRCNNSAIPLANGRQYQSGIYYDL